MNTKRSRTRQALGWTAAAILPVVAALWSEAATGRQTTPRPNRSTSKSTTPVRTPKTEAGTPKAESRLSYNRDVLPILAENCFACHGPDSAARKAGLRLDRPAEATADRGGHAAIVKGNPAAS